MTVAAIGHVVTGEGSPAHSGKNAFLFCGLILMGPGRYSVDALIRRAVNGTMVATGDRASCATEPS